MAPNPDSEPPALPPPKEHTGDLVTDMLLDTRERAAAAQGAAEQAAKAPAMTVRAIEKLLANKSTVEAADLFKASRALSSTADGVTRTLQSASEAAQKTERAARAASAAPTQRQQWAVIAICTASAALIMLTAGIGGWFARSIIAPELGLTHPVCVGEANYWTTSDSGVEYALCIVGPSGRSETGS